MIIILGNQPTHERLQPERKMNMEIITKRIAYKSDEELWKIERAAKLLGVREISNCYWMQVFRDEETGYEFCAERE